MLPEQVFLQHYFQRKPDACGPEFNHNAKQALSMLYNRLRFVSECNNVTGNTF